MKPLPELEFCRSIFSYDPSTGVLVWKEDRWCKKVKGKTVGWPNHRGYLMVNILGKKYMVHRLCYMLATGFDPGQHEIDHVNGVPNDNRMVNLRLATHSQNGMNGALRKDNTSGHKGVMWRKSQQRWIALVVLDGKKIYLGSYKTKEDAIAARRAGELKYFGQFVRHHVTHQPH